MRYMSIRRKLVESNLLLVGIVMVMLACLLTAACGGETTYEYERSRQDEILSAGQDAVPIYYPENFLARQAIAEYMERMDTPGKLWYIYIYGETGAFIGYFISRTYPISIAVAMSNPMQIVYSEDLTIPAPGIDAVYYNGVDPVLYYFFDASTNAMVLMRSELWIAMDVPLDLEIPVLQFRSITE